MTWPIDLILIFLFIGLLTVALDWVYGIFK